MFALLEHDPTPSTGAPPAGPLHWDLLVAVAGLERVPTWRLVANPLAAAAPIPAERIADHRPLYLTYEGPVSGDRGRVRRLDEGRADVLALDGPRLLVVFHGQRLRGRWEVVAGGTGHVLRRVAGP